MAMQRQAFERAPQFQRFFLPNVRPTGRRLGHGSYGVVEELEMSGVKVAGKMIYEVLVNQANDGVDVVVRKYVQECQIMSDMRHPHIVQFLGLCFLEESSLPVLVMELLMTSLDDLLERTPNIPLATKKAMLADVARGLVYLHNRPQPVIHRDLSAKNVLLNSALVAKISDLGNSRIVNFQPGQLARTLSRLPGTLVYMPPEVFDLQSRYGPQVDIFSFGHLALFTIGQIFPGDLLPSTYPDPQNLSRVLARSEVERREDFLVRVRRQLGGRHPLIQLITQCLHNYPAYRPSAEEVVHRLEQLEIEDPYQDLTKIEMIRRIEEKEELVRTKDEEIQNLRDVQQLRTQFQLDISIKEDLIVSLRRELAACRAERDLAHEEVRRLAGPHVHGRASFECTQCRDLPAEMSSPQGVILGNRLYVGGGICFGTEATIYTCSLAVDMWSTIPAPTQHFALVTYQSQLVIAGGTAPTTNSLWTMGMDAQTWTQPFPPMPTQRYGAVAISIENYLIVAGGYGVDYKCINVVEVFDGHQWVATDPLPRVCGYIKSTCHNGFWYLMGGVAQKKSVFYASLWDLVTKASRQPPASRRAGEESVWKTLPDVPWFYCSATTSGNALLAIGGFGEDTHTVSSSIHVYSPLTHTWEKVGDLPEGVCYSCSLTLPNGEVLVVGGYRGLTYSKHVYKATRLG